MKSSTLLLTVVFLSCMATITVAQDNSLPQNKGYKKFPGQSNPKNSRLLTNLLSRQSQYFKPILDSLPQNKLQVIYTEIRRNHRGKPCFRYHFFNVSDAYHYPASTVKLAAAVVALEKLHTLNIPGLDKNTTMLTGGIRTGENPVLNDPTANGGQPAIGHYIKKILLVSDNDAYNRLYEFIGQEALNNRLHDLGFTRAQLLHRLSLPLSAAQNRLTNPITFTDSLGNVIYSQPAVNSGLVYQQRNDQVGNGYMSGGSFYNGETLVPTPMDFSAKNRWPLSSHHQLVQWIMFPESQPKNNRLKLTPADYDFLRQYMGMQPQQSDYPSYAPPDYWPAYVKFLLLGSEKGPWPGEHLKIFNKVGDAYGFLIDGAYIKDEKSGVEFMLSAMIYCNSDGILNDDKYDYDSVGFPFMKHLGEVVMDFEKRKKRK